MPLNGSVSTKTRIPLLFLNMFDCPGNDEQALFFARKLPSDIGRWSSTAPYQVTVGHSEDISLRAQEIGRRYQADYVLSGDLVCLSDGIRSSVSILETKEGHQLWAKTYNLTGNDTTILVDTLAGFDCGSSDAELVAEALNHCDRAITLNKDSVYNLNRCSRVHRVLGSRMLSLQLAERVDELTLGLFTYTLYPALIANGKSQQVVEHARDNPKATLSWASDAGVIIGSYDEAEAVVRHSVTRSPSAYLGWMRLANVLGLLGRSNEAREALTEARRIGPPGWNLEKYLRSLRVNWRDNADILHPLTSGLRTIEEEQVPLFEATGLGQDSSSTEGDLLQKLSNRQRTVLGMALKGMLNKVIADELDIAEGTVKAHMSAAFRILGVKNRTEAVYLLSRKNTALDI